MTHLKWAPKHGERLNNGQSLHSGLRGVRVVLTDTAPRCVACGRLIPSYVRTGATTCDKRCCAHATRLRKEGIPLTGDWDRCEWGRSAGSKKRRPMTPERKAQQSDAMRAFHRRRSQERAS